MTEEQKDLEQNLEETPPIADATPESENEIVDSETTETAETTESSAPAEPSAIEASAEEKTEAPEETKSAKESGSQVDYTGTFRSLNRGDRVNGVVVHIDKEGVLVDVGTKSEGLIRPEELASHHVNSPEDVVTVGEQIDVYVMESEDQEGNLILSKKRADFERAWERVEQAFQEGKVLSAMVMDRVKGGLQVDLGIRGFIPASHVGSGKIKNLDKFIGQSLSLKVIEVDRERRKVVLSNRKAIDEQREKEREKTIKTLIEGQIRDGVVRRITDYGAFIDLGGMDGLLHISEMSWTRITHPSEVVKVGQKLQVMVLRLDLNNDRISLGLRQILPDPWADIAGKYRVGDLVKGSVSRLVPFGAFVQLEEGIEAIIPNTELSVKRVKRPEDIVTVGQDVEVRVIDIRPEERRMSLSLRQLEEEKESKEYQSYKTSNSGFDGKMTLGDLIGDKLQGFVGNQQAETAPEAEVEAETPEAEVETAPEAEAETEAPAAEVETAPEAEAETEADKSSETEEK